MAKKTTALPFRGPQDFLKTDEDTLREVVERINGAMTVECREFVDDAWFMVVAFEHKGPLPRHVKDGLMEGYRTAWDAVVISQLSANEHQIKLKFPKGE